MCDVSHKILLLAIQHINNKTNIYYPDRGLYLLILRLINITLCYQYLMCVMVSTQLTCIGGYGILDHFPAD
ncbi:hypothetical protein DYG65_01730 [Yersinia enterocolitica]|nr:hypothetical protein [Yersinia enterocolitica]